MQVIQSVDKTRTIDPASGWHDQGFGDVRSLHVYFQKYKFQPDKLGRATLLSEFGGYIHRVEGHAVGGRSVGYKTCDAPLSLEYALQALYDEQIRPAIAQGLSARGVHAAERCGARAQRPRDLRPQHREAPGADAAQDLLYRK